ncbi:hypothetical protein A8950_1835 [Dongia mobilis]|uniref:Uncharacterized protein n=2 Tax=Dongia mobilis TaxID=578943 RepID=A0A4R6WWU1_9PROT|nr:hypothetical protein A8950_1835 [Dongia mobilis]
MEMRKTCTRNNPAAPHLVQKNSGKRIPAAQVQDVRHVIQELVREVTHDLATRSGNPGVLLDTELNFEAQARVLRNAFNAKLGA